MMAFANIGRRAGTRSGRRAGFARSLCAGGLLLAAAAASAQDPAAGERSVTLSGSAGLVSDYRFRGVSLSDRNPALQGHIAIATPSGVFGSIWGSTIENFNGAASEIDLTAGWSGRLGFFTPAAGVIAYLYPGGTRPDYVELFMSMGATLGPASLTVGLNFSPASEKLLSDRYVYGAASVGIAGTPLTANASLGFERGGLVPDQTGRNDVKVDWLLGLDATFDPVVVGFSYVGSNLPRRFSSGPMQGGRANRGAGHGVVVTLGASF